MDRIAFDSAFEKIVEILRVDPFSVEDSLTPATEIKSLKKWDSLKHLSLLLELEKSFGAEVDGLGLARARTIKDLVDLVTK